MTSMRPLIGPPPLSLVPELQNGPTPRALPRPAFRGNVPRSPCRQTDAAQAIRGAVMSRPAHTDSHALLLCALLFSLLHSPRSIMYCRRLALPIRSVPYKTLAPESHIRSPDHPCCFTQHTSFLIPRKRWAHRLGPAVKCPVKTSSSLETQQGATERKSMVVIIISQCVQGLVSMLMLMVLFVRR